MPAYLWDLDIKVWKNPESNSLSFFELAVGLLNGQFGKWPFNCLADRFYFFALNRPYSHMVWVKQPCTTCLLLKNTALCCLRNKYLIMKNRKLIDAERIECKSEQRSLFRLNPFLPTLKNDPFS